MNQEVELKELLDGIEALMGKLDLWQTHSPSPEALLSRQPFCMDTLSFSQWLQFMFLPRMREILEQQQAWPNSCEIKPMAEEYFKSTTVQAGDLIRVLGSVDALISGFES